MSDENYELVFGSLDWSPTAQKSAEVKVTVHGLTRQGVVPVVSVVDSLIQDGAIEQVDGYGNRTHSVLLCLSSSSTRALDDYEAALFLECQKDRNELSFTSVDGYGATSVFEVLHATPARSQEGDWDLDEVLHGKRYWLVEFRCSPFPRSKDPVTTTAVTSTGSLGQTTIADGSSATNWTYAVDGGTPAAASATGGEVYATVTSTAPVSLFYTPAAPINMTSTPYLVVEWRIPSPLIGSIDVYADSVRLTQIADFALTDGLHRRSVYSCPDTSVAVIKVRGQGYTIDGSAGSSTLRVDLVARTDTAPTPTGSLKQKLSTLAVSGSARTQGRLALSHATSALGDVIVCTFPDDQRGYSPDMMRWLGALHGSAVSGDVNSQGYSDTVQFRPPSRMFKPGPYLAVARIKSTIGGHTSPLSWTGGVVDNNYSWPADWTNVDLGIISLPVTAVSETSTALEDIRVLCGSNGAVVELWLFPLTDGSWLTRAALGTAAPSATGSSNRLWLDTPTLDRPYQSIWRGTLADRSDARHAGASVSAWGLHEFVPPTMTVFVVSSNADDVAVSLEHYPRWHTNARL